MGQRMAWTTACQPVQPFNKASHSSQRTKQLRYGCCGSLARWISINCTWPDHAEATNPQDTAEHAEPDRLQRSSSIKLSLKNDHKNTTLHHNSASIS
jgi:hypothetical protein